MTSHLHFYIRTSSFPCAPHIPCPLSPRLLIPARPRAASALQSICQVAAPNLAAARVLPPLMHSCLLAAGEGMDIEGRKAIARGLATVAVALPPGEAKGALADLAKGSVEIVRHLATTQVRLALNHL